MEIESLDQVGINFLINQEGIVLHPYMDSVGVCTIGIGCTYYPTTGLKVKMSDPVLTRQQAIDMFMLMVKPYELAVYSTTRDDITQNEFNSLAAITYNIGVNGFKGSTLLKRVNNNPSDQVGIGEAFLMWDKAGGKVDSDIVALRKRQISLYFQK